MNNLKRRFLGFTLIELMIVITIIGFLASIAIPKFSNLIRKAYEGKALASLGGFRSAMSIYYADMEGVFPCDPISLTANGKYMTSIPSIRIPDYHPETSLYNAVPNFWSPI